MTTLLPYLSYLSYKKKHIVSLFLLFLFFVFSWSLSIQHVYGASSLFTPANYVPIAKTNVPEGAIISFDQGSYTISHTPYDKAMVGIITSTPAVSQTIDSTTPYYPIVTSGESTLLVSTKNGVIKKGDFLTSSTIPGVAVKATTSGYVIGTAVTNYSEKTIGSIPVTIDIHFIYIQDSNMVSNAVNFLRFHSNLTSEYALLTFKYVLASAIISLTLFFAFILISKTANKGIDALGRNPLASRQIHIGIMLNIFISILIMTIGSVASFFVLKM